ncbi:hypothetical protein [Methylobacterium sp. J-090]|uniref:hypothetical protein n=1 Tax=Methylobacterium sp. J-090 TaxID=2836666 RepID=UPI001FBA6378|nr:hypothetical protein [Methylobacterium sp. J-090]MCJ2081849.1 hypothetical protein [Methylobacterium sp. J-090]
MRRRLAKVSPGTVAPIVPAGVIRRFASYGAILAVVLAGLAAAETLRRAEPFIGSRIADMFVFAILRNKAEPRAPTFATAHAPPFDLSGAAGRL